MAMFTLGSFFRAYLCKIVLQNFKNIKPSIITFVYTGVVN